MKNKTVSEQPKRPRGRPTVPKDDRRRRVFIRLKLPPQEEWREMLRKAGYETDTAFYQSCVDWFLLSQPKSEEVKK
jgi:hypothetical protein